MWKKIIKIVALRDVYLGDRFFWLFGGVTAMFIASFPFPFLLAVAKASLVGSGVLILVDAFLLFNRGVQVDCERVLPRQLSLGDENTVELNLHNQYGLGLELQLLMNFLLSFKNEILKSMTI